MKLTAENVESTFKSCLAENHKADGVVVDGVIIKAKFNTNAISEHKKDIQDMLTQLPNEFQYDGGGGWSFLNMCTDRHGNQWTGFHRTMDMLVCLGIAAGFVRFLLPREMWNIMPGGMPYLVITT